ncbi:pilus assembly protein CpaE [Cellulomonas sp. APG4]|uniref:pilus assembly protein CpaE n=1 Tax=Cellulomonas sp. APG4 TaxID=1538656 RepID=UPI0013795CE6|nr:pilus assembly protein CpaE [Cellulomonas sp. APG4]NCT90649.1 pilus assembly protein CpaE [Cellulomonas sp. APG4]
MISQHLAQALRDAGVRWSPAAGDRFVIPQPELDGEVFTLSEMTIEAREYPTGTILGFNGTTEWALDSVAQDDALWLPREDQLRTLLGRTFVSLEQTDPDGAEPWVVTTRRDGGTETFAADAAAEALGLAVLDLARRATAPIT